MLRVFESVGASAFDLTMTNESGQKHEFQRQSSSEDLNGRLSKLLKDCEKQQLNLIVRPILQDDLRLVQLDDLDRQQCDRIKHLALLVIETSPHNYQAWLAIEECDKPTERRLKIGIGADRQASGATRLAGSLNFKEKYSPNYPRVRIAHVSPGRIVRLSEIQPFLPDGCPPPHAPSAPIGGKRARSNTP